MTTLVPGTKINKGEIDRVLDTFLGDDYKESVLLTEVPGEKIDVAYPDSAELSEALNATGTALVFDSDPEKKDFPFVPTGLDGRTAAAAFGGKVYGIEVPDTIKQNAVVAAESFGIGSCYIGDIMENIEEQRDILGLPSYVFPAAMLVFGYPTEQQLLRQKPERADLKYVVHENGYHTLSSEELKDMLSFYSGGQDYRSWLKAFCDRKYNSDFSREMTRSVKKYLDDFSTIG